MKLFGNVWFFWATPIRESQLVNDGSYVLLWYGIAIGNVSVGVMLRRVKSPAWE
jgi:hypothetical protein